MFRRKLRNFCTELDTGFKACFYSVMKNETHDISERVWKDLEEKQKLSMEK